ncbi:MAG: hypothetical protein JST22_17675 [Bacteroidetes bacterium]|nr:hypothetical protein [Bacteroidota bacterium]
MSVLWNDKDKQIELNLAENANPFEHAIVTVAFADGWRKGVDLYLVPDPEHPNSRILVQRWQNCGTIRSFVQTLRAGVYHMVPCFSPDPCSASATSELTGVPPSPTIDPSGTVDRVVYFEWDFGLCLPPNEPSLEKAGIAIMLVDSSMGPREASVLAPEPIHANGQ